MTDPIKPATARCWFLHRWSMWLDTYRGGTVILQERECLDCGAKVRRYA